MFPLYLYVLCRTSCKIRESIEIKEKLALHGLMLYAFICDALYDFVSFIQFKKHVKHLWRSVTFGKVAG